jgi:hypothetical protein
MSQSPDEPLWDEPPSHSHATRVDTAHVRAGEQPPREQSPPREAAEPPLAAAVAAESNAAVTGQQVRLQAAQLATHLQRQQAAVDHRESQLNARLAAVENQIRAARLWLDERHAEMAAKTAELDRRERELEARQGQEASVPRAATLEQHGEELDGEAERLNVWRENLEQAEMLLGGQQAECERKRRDLDDERARFLESMQAERRKLADERQRAAAEHERIAADLKRQGEELAARHAALERLRGDVKRAQHEALEMRLATEELWSRLCGTMAPAALAQSLAQVRLKLAEEQRLERAELAAERTEVQALAEQLARQHARLREARSQFEAWVQARREELERQAGLLAARERQLEDAQVHQQQQAAQWQSERFRLEQEIRRLMRQSDHAQNVAAA